MTNFAEFWMFSKEYFLNVVFPRFVEMVFLPIQKKEALEILIPLFVTLFLVQMYFGRNRDETIGWNSAYANCIVLLFVTAHLGNYVYGLYGTSGLDVFGNTAFSKSILVLAMGLVALGLMFIDYFHSVNEKISFLLSSSIFLTVFSFVSVVLVYSDIPFDRDTLITSIFIFIFVSIFFRLFRWTIPPSSTAQRYIEEKRKERYEKVKSTKNKLGYGLRKSKDKMNKFFDGPKFR